MTPNMLRTFAAFELRCIAVGGLLGFLVGVMLEVSGGRVHPAD